MTDPRSDAPPPDDRDATLLRLGERHRALFERYAALTGPGHTDFTVARQLVDEMNAMEDQIVELPALTPAGLVVRLRVLWTNLDHDLTSMFRPPATDDDILRRMTWSLLKDAERIAGEA